MPKTSYEVETDDAIYDVDADSEDEARAKVRAHLAKSAAPAPAAAARPPAAPALVSSHSSAAAVAEDDGEPLDEPTSLGARPSLSQRSGMRSAAPLPPPPASVTPATPAGASAPVQRSRFDIPKGAGQAVMSVLDSVGEALGGSTELPSESVRPGKSLYAGKPLGAKPTTQPASDLLTPADIATLGPLRRGLLQPATKIQEAIHEEATGPMIEQPIRRAAETAGNALRGLKIPAADRGMQAPTVGNELGRMPGDIVQGLGNAVGAAASDPIMLAATAAGGGMPALGTKALEGMGGYFGVKGAHELTANAIPEAVANYGTATPEEKSKIVQNLVEQGALTASMAPGILHSIRGEHRPLPKIESGGIKDQIDYDVNLGNMWPRTEQEPMPPLKPWQKGEAPPPSVDTRAGTVVIDGGSVGAERRAMNAQKNGRPSLGSRSGQRYVRQGDGSFSPGARLPSPMEQGGSNRGMPYDMNNGPGAPWDIATDPLAREAGDPGNPAEAAGPTALPRAANSATGPKPGAAADFAFNPKTDPFDALTAEALGNRDPVDAPKPTPAAVAVGPWRPAPDPIGDFVDEVRASAPNMAAGARGSFEPAPAAEPAAAAAPAPAAAPRRAAPAPGAPGAGPNSVLENPFDDTRSAAQYEPAPWADLLKGLLDNPAEGGARFAQQLQHAQSRGGHGPLIDALDSMLPVASQGVLEGPRRGLKAVAPAPGASAAGPAGGAPAPGTPLRLRDVETLFPDLYDQISKNTEKAMWSSDRGLKQETVASNKALMAEAQRRLDDQRAADAAPATGDAGHVPPPGQAGPARMPGPLEGAAVPPQGMSGMSFADRVRAKREAAARPAPDPRWAPEQAAVEPPAPAPAPLRDVAQNRPGEVPPNVVERPAGPPPAAEPPPPPAATEPAPTAPVPESTVPEAPETIEIQLDKLAKGERGAVMIPKGQPIPARPKGVGRVDVSGGDAPATWFFDKNKYRPTHVEEAAQTPAGRARLLGKPPKPTDPTTPVAVATVRTPEGVETEGTVVTRENAPAVLQDQTARAAAAGRGETVGLETPDEVTGKREAAAATPAPSFADRQKMKRGEIPAPAPAPSPDAPVTRAWRAGDNIGSVVFQNKDHADLFDLGGKMRYSVRGGQDKTHQRRLGDVEGLTNSLAGRLGIKPAEVRAMALAVHDAAKAEMKGVKDGETRALTFRGQAPAAPDAAPRSPAPTPAAEAPWGPAEEPTTPTPQPPPTEAGKASTPGASPQAEGGEASSEAPAPAPTPPAPAAAPDRAPAPDPGPVGPSGFKMADLEHAADTLGIKLPSRESFKESEAQLRGRAEMDFEKLSRNLLAAGRQQGDAKDAPKLRKDLDRAQAYVAMTHLRHLTDTVMPALTEKIDAARAKGEAGAADVKSAQAEMTDTLSQIDGLTTRLYESGSEAGRRLAFQKAVFPDGGGPGSDLDAASAIKRGMALTNGKLSKETQKYIIERVEAGKRYDTKIRERLKEEVAAARERMDAAKPEEWAEAVKKFKPEDLGKCR